MVYILLYSADVDIGGGLQEARLPLRKSNLFDVDPACCGSGKEAAA